MEAQQQHIEEKDVVEPEQKMCNTLADKEDEDVQFFGHCEYRNLVLASARGTLGTKGDLTRLKDSLQKKGFVVTIQTQGFRAEYNGLPVICYHTGQTFTTSWGNLYWGGGVQQLCEYAIIRHHKDKVYLTSYYGMAGRGPSSAFKDALVECFLSHVVVG